MAKKNNYDTGGMLLTKYVLRTRKNKATTEKKSFLAQYQINSGFN